MKIIADLTKYNITYNDEEVYTYNYRFTDLDRVDSVEVKGNVELSLVQSWVQKQPKTNHDT